MIESDFSIYSGFLNSAAAIYCKIFEFRPLNFPSFYRSPQFRPKLTLVETSVIDSTRDAYPSGITMLWIRIAAPSIRYEARPETFTFFLS